jgi:hypothetical protein
MDVQNKKGVLLNVNKINMQDKANKNTKTLDIVNKVIN